MMTSSPANLCTQHSHRNRNCSFLSVGVRLEEMNTLSLIAALADQNKVCATDDTLLWLVKDANLTSNICSLLGTLQSIRLQVKDWFRCNSDEKIFVCWSQIHHPIEQHLR